MAGSFTTLYPWWQSMSIAPFMPTPPSSPSPPDTDTDGEVHKVKAEQPEGGEESKPQGGEQEKKAYQVKKGGLAEYKRSAPLWDKLKTAENDLGLRMVNTNCTKNLCLLFSYLVATEEMNESEQQNSCVLARAAV